MSWWKRWIEKLKRYIEDTAKANEKMWKGQEPSCCKKEKEENYEKNKKILDKFLF